MSLYAETIGYIIHQRNFKDSSLIIEFFSKDIGKIQLIAKGIKTNKKLKPQIQLFSLLKIQFFGKSQLKTLSAVNIVSQYNYSGIIERTAGLYLNELLHYSLVEFEKTEDVFNDYQNTLRELGKQKLTPLLRQFEKGILRYSGFELNVDSFENAESWITIDNLKGLIETNTHSQKLCKVDDLTKFLDDKQLNPREQKRINRLMLKAIDMCVSHKRLYSRELLKSIFSQVVSLPKIDESN